MRKRRVYGVFACSTVVAVAAGWLALTLRQSDAVKPSGAVAAEPDAGATDRVAAGGGVSLAASPSGNRIRFGAAVSNDPSIDPINGPTGGPMSRGGDDRYAITSPRSTNTLGAAAVADRFNGYAVVQAAAEAPVDPAPVNAPPPNALPNPPAAFAQVAAEGRYTASAPTPAPPQVPLNTPVALPSAITGVDASSSATLGTPTAAPVRNNPSPPFVAAAPAASNAASPPPFSASPPRSFPAAQTPTTPTIPSAQPLSRPIATPMVPAVSSHASAGASVHAGADAGGAGRPGEKSLEGTQTPTLVIEKFAPAEIQVGKPALFEILVRNTGATAAAGVEIHDVVPQGTQLLNTKPVAQRGARGELVWSLGAIKPNEEAVVQLELMPTTEGEIGSIATVHFAAAASVRTICTKPELVIDVQAPRVVLAGDDVPLKVRVSNPGSGAATGVVLTEIVPAGMEHEGGAELEYAVGDLQPGEARDIELTLRAMKPGQTVNVIKGQGDGRVAAEAKTQIEVVAPALAVDIEGPKRRFLDRQATYVVSLSNPGTAAAREVELATYLPRGMQFVEADNQGEYNPETHSVHWLLEELPPQQRGSVTLTTVPIEPGQQLLRVESSADRGVTAKKEEAVMVEGAAAIVFQVVDSADPIEVGGETTYEIVVANQGSKEATGVQMTIALPDGLQAVEADGPTRFALTARQVQFQPVAQLAPKGEAVFHVRARCLAAGDHRCHVQLMSDDMRSPVTKEEGTRVYADE